jgi:pilus assembly protein FimV
LGDLNLTDEDLIGDLRRFGDDATEPFPSLAEIDLEGAPAGAGPEPASAGLPDIDGDGLHQALRIFEEAETVDAESLGDLDLFDEGRVVEFAKGGKEDSAADSESIDELLNFDFSAGDGDLASGDRFPPLSDFGSLQSDSGDGTPPKDPLWDLEDILALDPEDESVRGDGDLGGDDTGRSEKSIEDILRELTRDLQPEDPAEVDSPESGVQPTGTASLELRLAPALPGADFSLDDRASVLKEFVDLDSGFLDDLSDLDQFETKLDLARAYADMGDGDAAREILLDVAAHGNDKQRIEADELLAKLPDLDPSTFLPRAKSA